MLRKLYDWTLAKAAHRLAPYWLGFIAFIESSVFPIPPDVLLAPMCLARRDSAFGFAAIATIGSTLGALLGYALGALAFEAIGQPLVALYGGEAAMSELKLLYAEQGAMIVAFAAFTPFPFKVVTVASGALGLDLGSFVVACLLARGGRFLLVSAILWRWGAPMQAFVEKPLGLVTLIAFLAVVAFLVLAKGVFA